MPLGNEPIDREIRALLQEVEGNEDLKAAAHDCLLDYRAFALARPRAEHVELLRVLLRTRLTSLVEAARRDGRL